MDELSKLKQMWTSSFEGKEQSMDANELMAIIRKKSSGPVEKLKRSLYLEIGTILLIIPFLVVVMFKLPQIYFILNTSVLLLLFIGALIYYYINLREVTELWNKSQDNLRESLESTLVLFRFFRRTYYYLNIALFPVGIYFGFIIGFGLGSGGKKVSTLLFFEGLPVIVNVLIWMGTFAFLFGLFMLFLRFYVKKLYDIHINKLSLIHKELTENEF
jgi:hypothetical protein